MSALSMASFSSCRVAKKIIKLKSVFQPKKNPYVDYNSMFDVEGNNLNPNVNNNPNFSTDNKIRIITINRITNDTIIEWVDPIEVGSGKRVLFSNDLEPKAPVEAVPIIVRDSLPPHEAIVFEYDTNYNPPMYFIKNDTIILRGSQAGIASILFPKAIEPKVEKTNLPKITPPFAGKKNTEKKIARADAKERKDTRKTANTGLAVVPKEIVTPAKPVVIPLVSDSARIVIIDSGMSFSENQLTVGDAMFDKDQTAEIFKDTAVLQQLLAPRITQWTSFKCKAKVQFKSKGKSQSFNTAIRMQKDSVTWASIIVLGELARAIVNKDSFMAIDKWNDQYYKFPVNGLQELLNLPLSFDQVQDLILGNVTSLNMKMVLAKKSNRGFAVKLTGSGLNTVLSFNKDSTLRSATIFGTNKNGRYSVKSTYDDYQETTVGKLAHGRTIRMLQNAHETFVEMDFQKCDFDMALEYPFAIPAKFKEAVTNKK